MESKRKFRLIFLAVFFLLALIEICNVAATPIGPTVSIIGNSTKNTGSGTAVNSSGNDTDNPNKAGGFIFTIGLSAESQNARWKAYVGNVSGTLVLDDADGYSIYDWTLSSSLSGEVYATRASGTISWGDVNCSTLVNMSNEEIAMNHTSNPNDNITATFDAQDNSEFYVGNQIIHANTCYTTNTYVDGSAPAGDEFEEILLHDGTNMIYSTIVEQDEGGYHTGESYDFQMILPERGYSGWASSTAYYFYVELS